MKNAFQFQLHSSPGCIPPEGDVYVIPGTNTNNHVNEVTVFIYRCMTSVHFLSMSLLFVFKVYQLEINGVCQILYNGVKLLMGSTLAL